MSEPQDPSAFAPPVSAFMGPVPELIAARMVSPPPRPGVLAILDHFEIVRVLGGGGMGLVLLVHVGHVGPDHVVGEGVLAHESLVDPDRPSIRRPIARPPGLHAPADNRPRHRGGPEQSGLTCCAPTRSLFCRCLLGEGFFEALIGGGQGFRMDASFCRDGHKIGVTDPTGKRV